ncbi:MAG: DUF4234 domain-containing protein [Synergistaceae bacterium]|nr:DUF4234 domain-containing protein [Synergistaceae bacterium]
MKVLKRGFREQMRRGRESREASVLGYIPTRLYAGMSLVTFGLYPYVWMWYNAEAFAKIGEGRIDKRAVRRCAASGFLAQLLIPAAAVYAAWWWFTGRAGVRDVLTALLAAYAVLQVLVVLPLSCSLRFCLRWALRGAVISWDRDGVMIERTAASWLKLFLFGSVYIQYHINRLIGLGMPGFADADEIEPDRSIGEIIDDYIIIGRTDYAAEPWTKDDYDWGPDDDDG